jgi:hypothetical protein
VQNWTLAMLAAAMLTAGCSGTSASPEAATGDADTAAAAAEKPAPAVPEYREITLPAGTTLPLELKTAVGSDTSNVEDAVRATLKRPVTIDGKEVLPAGTDVFGAVTAADRAGRVKGRARIAFRFTSLEYDSERHDIRTEPIGRLAEATKKQDAAKIAGGAAAGAVIGGILGGGGGAAKGAAIGGAGGTGVVLATRGKEVRLNAGASVSTKLTAPLTIRVKIS